MRLHRLALLATLVIGCATPQARRAPRVAAPASRPSPLGPTTMPVGQSDPELCGASEPAGEGGGAHRRALRVQTPAAASCDILTKTKGPGDAALYRCVCRHLCRVKLPGEAPRQRIGYPPGGVFLEAERGRVVACRHEALGVEVPCDSPWLSAAELSSGALQALDPAGTRAHLPGLELEGLGGRVFGSDTSSRPPVLYSVRLRLTRRGRPDDAPRRVRVEAAWLVKTDARQTTQGREAEPLRDLALQREGQSASLPRRTVSLAPCSRVELRLGFRAVPSSTALQRAVRVRLRVDGQSVELEVPVTLWTFIGEPDVQGELIPR